MPHGWIVVDKPLGLSSAAVVGRIKRFARMAGWGRPRVGHGGTLDPLATGVLPVALGEATKLTGRMLGADKAYRFELSFGAATATDDTEGDVVAVSAMRPSRDALEGMLSRFTGPIRQRPPAYSALKVDGRRAYARARAGETVELAERAVTIHALGLEGTRGPPGALEAATLVVRSSKGTYVRSLARDIALALGTVGHVSALRRTRAGPFGEEQALGLDRLEAMCDDCRLAEAILPLVSGLVDIPALEIAPAEAAALRQGRALGALPRWPSLFLATDAGAPVALVVVADGVARVERGFNPDVAE